MIKSLYALLSRIFLKAHLIFKYKANTWKRFKPYIIKHKVYKDRPLILHFNANFIVGGTTQIIVDIIERTSEHFLHKIVVPDFQYPLPYKPVDIHKFNLEQIDSLYHFIKKENPALIHIQYWGLEKERYATPSIWYTFIFKICEELNIKVIQNINLPALPYISPSVVHNVFVSSYVKDKFNNSDTPSSVIYPGSDFTHFKSNLKVSSLSSFTIGMVYRLDRDKLSSESIEVFILAAKRLPFLIGLIVGDGYYLKYFRKRVKTEGLEKRIIFTGLISYAELPKYYQKMDLFITPVYNESFGQVTPFAMSMGLCVAGYDTGAISEILGYSNTLVKTGDINALVDVIVDLANNKEKRKEYARRNQNRALSLFSVESMVSKYSGLYSQFINE